VIRCFALAEELVAQGEEVTVAVASLPQTLGEMMRSAGVRLERLDAAIGSPDDARRTAQLAAELRVHWLVLDGYDFGPSFQALVRRAGTRVLLVDDLGQTPTCSVDLIVNQNVYAHPRLYAGVPHDTRLLLGTRYALLRRQFIGSRPSPRVVSDIARHVLVTLGGGDAANSLRRVLELLVRELPISCEIVVVTGAASDPTSDWGDVVRRAAMPVRIEHDVRDMASLMAWADLAVCGGGTSCLEFAFMGVPMCIVIMADNQRMGARAFDEAGAAVNLDAWSADHDQARLIGLLTVDRARRAEMSSRGMALVDGKGASRIVAAMRTATLQVRVADPRDEELLWQWRNDPVVRDWSFRTDPIPRTEHAEWFGRVLSGADSVIWICCDADGTPIGQARIRGIGAEPEISVSVAAPWRGRGYGRALIDVVTERYLATRPNGTAVTALIKVGNEGSRRAFESASYTFDAEVDVSGKRAWRYVRRKQEDGA
jgi:UDP-2,4-diacetamido-2,4,6-trideoxy-beta-L-altropyranose hydrolase